MRTSCVSENKQKNPPRIRASFSPFHPRVSFQSRSELNLKNAVNEINNSRRYSRDKWSNADCLHEFPPAAHPFSNSACSLGGHRGETRACHSCMVGAAPRASRPQKAKSCRKEIQQITIKEFQCLKLLPGVQLLFQLGQSWRVPCWSKPHHEILSAGLKCL